MMGGGMMGGFGSGFGSGFGGLGLIGMVVNLAITLAFIVGLVLLVAWLWRRVNLGGQVLATSQVNAGPSSKDVLQTRYAQGEITREQYQQMLADLNA